MTFLFYLNETALFWLQGHLKFRKLQCKHVLAKRSTDMVRHVVRIPLKSDAKKIVTGVTNAKGKLNEPQNKGFHDESDSMLH